MSARPVVMWAPIVDFGSGERIVTGLRGDSQQECHDDFWRDKPPGIFTVRFARVTVTETEEQK